MGWVRRGGPVARPPSSSTMSCFGVFFRGRLKSVVYEIPLDCEKDPIARLAAPTGEVQNMSGIFQSVRQSFAVVHLASVLELALLCEHLL
ncbi:hypothetical protein TNCV_2024251 [Trichonephila clavipes]|nr:hypothetical protein TNCV_2024251 [Trichonephila clavipes]